MSARTDLNETEQEVLLDIKIKSFKSFKEMKENRRTAQIVF